MWSQKKGAPNDDRPTIEIWCRQLRRTGVFEVRAPPNAAEQALAWNFTSLKSRHCHLLSVSSALPVAKYLSGVMFIREALDYSLNA
jgi:hypothetical protein